MERRFCTSQIPEIRQDGAGKRTITGYAAVYYRDGDPGTEYQLYSGMGFAVFERLMPGCFDRACREDDVRGLFNHEAGCILGRTTAGTMRLSVDSVGLRYDIDVPDTTAARDLLVSLERRDVTGSSFSFDYRDKSIREIDNPDGSMQDILEVNDVTLYDVGPVVFPAYTATTAGARTLSSAEGERLARERMQRRRAALRTRVGARCIELGI